MRYFHYFWKGMIISISQLIPGVSGSTIAIVLGLYDQLLEAVNRLWKDFRKHSQLLIAVCVGAVIGLAVFSRGIRWLLETFPVPLGIFFIGVILGGAPLMYGKASERGLNQSNWIYFGVGLLIVLLMGLQIESNASPIVEVNFFDWMKLFLCGVVFAIALILPGISGSFMLLVLGLYQTVIVAASDMNLQVLIPLGVGTVVGLFITARVIEWLLQRHPQQSYLLILGFVVGSVYEVFPGWPQTWMEWLVSVIVFLGGFLFVYKTAKV